MVRCAFTEVIVPMKLERRVEISWRDTIYVRDHGPDEYILTENRERVREAVDVSGSLLTWAVASQFSIETKSHTN